MRPFNDREKKLKSGKCVDMTGQMTTITDPESGKERQFSFNYCYDSHIPGSENFASQEQVFNDLGTAYLENAWAGYNCSIFAYGQTGAGKSYSMTGAPGQPGIIPRGLAEMFNRVNSTEEEGLSFRVEVSYLEIYMEKIRDLFNPKQEVPSLKVRESPKLGIYVEGLKKMEVTSYADVERLMELGNNLRTVAQTNMNAVSSRSHSVLTILLTQTRVNRETMTASDMTSKINLIDLAGSERQGKTGATGTRLKEGSAINQSLTALGNVIEALADNSAASSNSKKKKRLVPYRDSKLTRILQESLGGNAKTIMVAAISPAADNFKETLSTLRYANRASKIQNVAVINESPNEKVIRELKDEVTRLKAMLAAASGEGGAILTEEELKQKEEMAAELEALREQLTKQKEYISEMGMSEEERAAMVNARAGQTAAEMAQALKALHGIDMDVDTTQPHFVNLHNTTLLYGLDEDSTVFGKAEEADVVLGGVLVQNLHCTVKNKDGQCTLVPHTNAVVFLDGNKLEAPALLHEGDRVCIGNNHFFRYVDPVEVQRQIDGGSEVTSMHYDLHFAVQELASHNPLTKIQKVAGETDAQAKRRGELELVLTDLLPYIMEANAVCKSLEKPRQFEPVFACDMSKGLSNATTEIRIKVVHTDDLERESFWSTERFEEELLTMKEIYQAYTATGTIELEDGYDPFDDPPGDELIGLAHVLLLPLSEGIPVGPNLHTPIWDATGGYQGGLIISIYVASVTGQIIEYEDLDDETWLAPGSRVDFLVSISSVVGVPLQYENGVYCKFKFFDTELVYTPPSVDSIVNHELNYSHVVTTNVTPDLVKALQEEELVVEVWAVAEKKAIAVQEMDGGPDGTKVPHFIGGGSEADLGEMDTSFMAEMLERMTPATFRPGQYLMREGDEGNSMFFVQSGSVDIELPTGETLRVREGTFLGELALFMSCRRTASVRAHTEVEVQVLTREVFDSVIENWPAAKAQFERLAEEHLQADKDRKRRRGSKAAQAGAWMKKVASVIQSAMADAAGAAPGDSEASSSSDAKAKAQSLLDDSSSDE